MGTVPIYLRRVHSPALNQLIYRPRHVPIADRPGMALAMPFPAAKRQPCSSFRLPEAKPQKR